MNVRRYSVVLLLCFAFVSQVAMAASPNVVMSQVYGGGGSGSGSPAYTNDYVELFNRSASPVVIGGWSLQYGSSTGQFASSSSNLYVFPAGTSIGAGQYLLVKLGSAGSLGAAFTADFTTGNLSMAAGSGKVVLANVSSALGCGASATPCALADARIVDLVSYGASNNAEGGAPVNNGTGLTSSVGAIRKLSGCQDTDNNNSDFTVATVAEGLVPRTLTSPVKSCQVVNPPIAPVIAPFTNPAATVAHDAMPFTVSLSGSSDNGSYNWSATSGTGVASVVVTAGQGTPNVTYTVTLNPGFSGTAAFTAVLSDGANVGMADVTITVTAPPPGPVDHLVISQVYGGGGNSGATYNRDYIELFNPTSQPVLVSGWSVQYSSAGGTFSQVQPLGGVIQPGEYYLVALKSGSVGAALPDPNISGSFDMSGTAGKVALVSSGDLAGSCTDATIVDLVGYGSSANCFEGGSRAPAPSNTTAIFRKDGGLRDTNNNGNDFQTGAPNPRRTATIGEIGPYVLSTDPRTNATTAPRDANITITFTEPVDVTGAWFNISCASSGLHNEATIGTAGDAWIIVPNATFVPGEQCTGTIYRTLVHDRDLDDSAPNTDTLHADYTWTFSIATGAAPAYTPDVHLTMGNPSGATADVAVPNNYLMVKPELALSYNRDRGTPNWVSWHLADEWVGTLARVDTFRADPAVPAEWYRVLGTDYFQSGFDRGHMVPNADRDPATSIPINQATFLMTNMIPQAPDNNQGPWADMENYLRTLLPANELYIVAGGSGVGGTGSNGFATTIVDGRVTVPASTWKVVLVIPKGTDDVSRVTPAARTIAVIMPNVQGIRNNDWTSYIVSVDAVEQLSGYDFFANVADPVEYSIEAGINGANPPVALDQSVNVTEDVAAALALQTMSANANPLTYTIVSGPSNGTLTGSGASQTYTPAPDFFGTDSFTFRVSDGSLNSQTATVTINVLPVNDAPVVTIAAPAASTEGAEVTASATVTDVDSSSFSYVWTATKDGSPFATATSTSFSFTPDDNGTYALSLSVTDAGGAAGSAGVSVAVSNVAPVIGSVSGPSAALTRGASASISFSYTDAGTADTHVANLTWDDGSTSPVVCAAGACTATHSYASAGVYGVGIQLLDDDGGSAAGRFEFVVVVDPSAGFANGGGWIVAPGTGKASFGFSSKYHETQGTLSGHTQFSTNTFEFSSVAYDSLVVAGSNAQIRGTGTINNAGNYGFVLTATDGDLPGGDRTDRFRIRIWDATTGAVVYDNSAGASDDIDAASPQALGGGNVSIQRK